MNTYAHRLTDGAVSGAERALGLALALALGLTACGKPLKKTSQVEAREASSDGVKKVEIRNTRGKIDIISMRSLQPRFKVTATKWAQAPGDSASKAALKRVVLRIYRAGSTAIIVIKHPADQGRTTYGADLSVTLPVELDVDVDNRHGDVRVLGMGGRVAVRTVTGSIEARAVDRHLKAHTTRGDIVASGHLESFDVHADRGQVKVFVRGRDHLEQASSVHVGRGDILVGLSQGFNAQLSARAAHGRLTLPFEGLKTTGDTRAGTLGKGGKLLSLQTDHGSIEVLAKLYSRMRFVPHSRLGGPRVRREMHPMHAPGAHDHGVAPMAGPPPRPVLRPRPR